MTKYDPRKFKHESEYDIAQMENKSFKSIQKEESRRYVFDWFENTCILVVAKDNDFNIDKHFISLVKFVLGFISFVILILYKLYNNVFICYFSLRIAKQEDAIERERELKEAKRKLKKLKKRWYYIY